MSEGVQQAYSVRESIQTLRELYTDLREEELFSEADAVQRGIEALTTLDLLRQVIK